MKIKFRVPVVAINFFYIMPKSHLFTMFLAIFLGFPGVMPKFLVGDYQLVFSIIMVGYAIKTAVDGLVKGGFLNGS